MLRHNLILFLVFFICSGILLLVNINAQTQPTAIKITPIDDNYVWLSQPDTVQGYGNGSGIEIWVEGNWTHPEAGVRNESIGYFKFDISGINPANFSYAYLWLYKISCDEYYWWDLTRYVYRVPSNAWNEETITYNNRPSYDPTPYASKSFGCSWSHNAGFILDRGWVWWDVSELVDEALAIGDDYISFAVVSPSGGVGFASKEWVWMGEDWVNPPSPPDYMMPTLEIYTPAHCVVGYCGMNIKRNTTLCPGSIFCPAGNGITISGNGVIVNANGFSVSGETWGYGAHSWKFTGSNSELRNCRGNRQWAIVYNLGGDGNTIRNCTLEGGFSTDYGIFNNEGANFRVIDTDVFNIYKFVDGHAPATGIWTNGANTQIINSNFKNMGTCIWTRGDRHTIVWNSTLDCNTDFSSGKYTTYNSTWDRPGADVTSYWYAYSYIEDETGLPQQGVRVIIYDSLNYTWSDDVTDSNGRTPLHLYPDYHLTNWENIIINYTPYRAKDIKGEFGLNRTFEPTVFSFIYIPPPPPPPPPICKIIECGEVDPQRKYTSLMTILLCDFFNWILCNPFILGIFLLVIIILYMFWWLKRDITPRWWDW